MSFPQGKDVAGAAVLSETDAIFTFKEEQKGCAQGAIFPSLPDDIVQYYWSCKRWYKIDICFPNHDLPLCLTRLIFL